MRHGTATPCHYVVIENETNLSPDILQQMSYKLTYQYFNWPGSIRVPAPCQVSNIWKSTSFQSSPWCSWRIFSFFKIFFSALFQQYAHKLAYLVGESVKRETSEVLSDKLFYLWFHILNLFLLLFKLYTNIFRFREKICRPMFWKQTFYQSKRHK